MAIELIPNIRILLAATMVLSSAIRGIVILKPDPVQIINKNSEENCTDMLKDLTPLSFAPASINYTGKFPRMWVRRSYEVTPTVLPSPGEPEVKLMAGNYSIKSTPVAYSELPDPPSSAISPLHQNGPKEILHLSPSEPSGPPHMSDTPQEDYVTMPNTSTNTPPNATYSMPISSHAANLENQFTPTISEISNRTDPTTDSRDGNLYVNDTLNEMSSKLVEDIIHGFQSFFATLSISYETTPISLITPTTDSSLHSIIIPTHTSNPRIVSHQILESQEQTDRPKLINIERSPTMDPISLEKELDMILASRLPLALDEDLLDLWRAPYLQRLKYVNHEMVDKILQAEIKAQPNALECPLEYQQLLLLSLQRILGLLLLSLPQSLKEVEEAMTDTELDAYFFRPQEKNILDVKNCRECYAKDPSGVCRQLFFCKNGARPGPVPRLTPAQLKALLSRRG